MSNEKVIDNSGIKGKFRVKQYKAGTKELISCGDWIENIVVTSTGNGLNKILKALLNSGQSVAITHAVIGTDGTAPSVNDTDLLAPLNYDILIADYEEVSNTQIRFDFFIPDAYLPNNTYREFGTKMGDNLFSRALISPVLVKTGAMDVSVEYLYQLTNA